MTEKLKVFLDNKRNPPEDYDLHIKSVKDAMSLIEAGRVAVISVDYEKDENKSEGKQVVLFIKNAFINGQIEYVDIETHSSDSAARKEVLYHRDLIFKHVQTQLKDGNEDPFQQMLRYYSCFIEKIILHLPQKSDTKVTFTELYEAGVYGFKEAILRSYNIDNFDRFFAWTIKQTLLGKLYDPIK